MTSADFASRLLGIIAFCLCDVVLFPFRTAEQVAWWNGISTKLSNKWIHVNLGVWGLLRAAALGLTIPAIYFYSVKMDQVTIDLHHTQWELGFWFFVVTILLDKTVHGMLHSRPGGLWGAFISQLFALAASALTLIYFGLFDSNSNTNLISFWFFMPYAIISLAFTGVLGNAVFDNPINRLLSAGRKNVERAHSTMLAAVPEKLSKRHADERSRDQY